MWRVPAGEWSSLPARPSVELDLLLRRESPQEPGVQADGAVRTFQVHVSIRLAIRVELGHFCPSGRPGLAPGWALLESYLGYNRDKRDSGRASLAVRSARQAMPGEVRTMRWDTWA